MGKRKRLLREKRKAKHQKVAMAVFNYRIGLEIKEYFRMSKQIDTYLDRLSIATLKREPLSMAVITYQAFRDSNAAIALKDMGIKEDYDTLAWDAVVRMAEILKKLEWEADDIQKFLVKSKELAGLE